MRTGRAIAVGMVILTAWGIASADEIVVFTNGTTMPIRQHSIDKGMISVDLGQNARIAFPLDMVERIEAAGRDVFVNPSYRPSNQLVPGAGGGGASSAYGQREPASYPVQGSSPARFASQSARRRAMAGEDPQDRLLYGDSGAPAAMERQVGSSVNTGLRGIRLMGDRSSRAASDEGGILGGPVTDKTIMMPKSSRRGPMGTPLVSLAPRSAGGGEGDAPPPPPDPPPADSGGGE